MTSGSTGIGQLIKIALVGDSAVYKETIKRLLTRYDDIQVVFDIDNGGDFLTTFEGKGSYDVALLDLEIQSFDVEEALRGQMALKSRSKVIALTAADNEENILNICRLGVKSLLLKATPIDEIVLAFRTVNNGGYYFPGEIGRLLIGAINVSSNKELHIDEFDLQVLRLTSLGHSSSRIAKYLNRSPRTIEDHRAKLYDLFDVRNKEQLLVTAVKAGIL